ncbi:hypothetical protein VIGAN_09005700 [Vigna angularis var. angularis]|uniref:Protein kinase domain-containing protein n=1 Tax=Vigna angularis var. angularis TaxID=157739 RepID=A0A0S3SV66_PHAAN|nr:hypothetical protein VIGAN_09005700 [Vigna angularis var. angularis]
MEYDEEDQRPELDGTPVAGNHVRPARSQISPNFNGLTCLSTLYLEHNNFTGSIPNLSVLPLDQFNVSYNSLIGPIPNRFSSLDQTAFIGNSLCGKPLQSCPGTEEGKSKLSGGAIAGIVIDSVVGLLLILLLLFFLCRKRSGKNDESMSIGKRDVGGEVSHDKSAESGNSSSAVAGSMEKSDVQSSGGGDKSLVFFGNVNRVLSLDELLMAYAEVLGKGTFGTTYKATLETTKMEAMGEERKQKWKEKRENGKRRRERGRGKLRNEIVGHSSTQHIHSIYSRQHMFTYNL